MTRTRSHFYSQCLPVAQGQRGLGLAPHIIVGPERREVERYAPSLLSPFAGSSPPLVLPSPKLSLAQIHDRILKHIAWTDGSWPACKGSVAMLIALPPGLRDRSLQGLGWRSEPNATAVENAAPALALVGSLPMIANGYDRGQVTTILETHEWQADRNTALFRTWEERFLWHVTHPLSPQLLIETVRDGLKEEAQGEKPASDSQTDPRLWIPELRFELPGAIWELEAEKSPVGARPITIVLWTGEHDMLPRHFRCVREFEIGDMRKDPDRAVALFQVACGLEGRTENDRFVPVHTMFTPATEWHDLEASADAFRLDRMVKGYGFPVRRVKEIGRVLEARGMKDCERAQLVQLRGYTPTDAGQPPRLIASTDATIESGVKGETPTDGTHPLDEIRFFVDCPEPEFFCDVFNLDEVQQWLLCNAVSGSLNRPNWHRSLIEEVQIPWPSSAEQAELREIESKARHAMETVSSRLRMLGAELEEHRIPPAVGAPHNLHMAQELNRILDQFEREYRGDDDARAKPSGPEKSTIYSVRQPMERLDNADEGWEKLTLTLDVAEAFVRTGAAVALSVVQAIDERILPQLWSKAMGHPTKARSGMLLSFGHWQNLLRHGMEAVRAHSKRAPGALQTLVTTVVGVDAQRVAATVASIVEARNRTKGHSMTLTAHDAKAELAALAPQLELLQTDLCFVKELDAMVIQSCRREHEQLVGRVTRLHKWFDEWPSSSVPRQLDSGLDRAIAGEIVLEGAGYVSLAPWMIFRDDPDTRRPCIWNFDGIRVRGKSRLAVYQCFHSTGQKKPEFADEAERVARILKLDDEEE